MKWFNYIGLIFVVAIMVPNVIFAITNKEGFKNYYKNRIIETFEQIGRLGCFIFMFINIPPLTIGYLFNKARLTYLILGSVLFLIYVSGWVIFRNKSSVAKSLLIHRSVAFIFSVRRFYT